MVTTAKPTRDLLTFFREYVLSPLETAEQRVESEQTDLAAEQRAYDQFHDRVCGIRTVSLAGSRTASLPQRSLNTRPHAAKDLRGAFRSTVMDVDHYVDVYDETLEEHVVAELSPEVATLFRDRPETRFTDSAKRVLMTAIQRAIDERTPALDSLEQEQRSLEVQYHGLTKLLNMHDGPRVPEWYRSEFETKLDELAQQRQETLNNRPPTTRIDGHDFCTYLYRDQGWTYPVLTAITRFRSAVA